MLLKESREHGVSRERKYCVLWSTQYAEPRKCGRCNPSTRCSELASGVCSAPVVLQRGMLCCLWAMGLRVHIRTASKPPRPGTHQKPSVIRSEVARLHGRARVQHRAVVGVVADRRVLSRNNIRSEATDGAVVLIPIHPKERRAGIQDGI